MPSRELSEYEKLRLKNIEDNKKILAQLGLLNPFKPLPRIVTGGVKRKRPQSNTPTKKRVIEETDKEYGSVHEVGRRRRSLRVRGKTPEETAELEDEEDEEYTPKKIYPKRENSYGAIEGVDVGFIWETRMECSRAGIHRPPVSGIHGGEHGAYSIALSGGYDDNVDLGECFTYTGEGGRDLRGTKANPKNLRTAPQSKDQTLTRGNLALYNSVESGHPVRVIRGYKLTSSFAPEEGYRYDGLYTVTKAWFSTGVSGFGVWRFALKRCPDQAPPPWTLTYAESPSKDKHKDVEETDPSAHQQEISAPDACDEEAAGTATTKILENQDVGKDDTKDGDKDDITADTDVDKDGDTEIKDHDNDSKSDISEGDSNGSPTSSEVDKEFDQVEDAAPHSPPSESDSRDSELSEASR
ncbi:E3 ubiquitin-protein ligase UHRF1-like [Lingula anatina]|uniref:E3 ubiquitin-protein ligase UHRF1-like n=1 Tax=Lingula anatina TaxID=7574 RepID=A0A1S3IBY7_LINAN|nr:E3 ubiquitin-protein ligase UHRF1-like [Lingula anatina]|eukprot:XP_013395770.1 E3 ubiquitin-protein ligase UHRF1-like [Lingula anatina]